jgi:hypothetical protein
MASTRAQRCTPRVRVYALVGDVCTGCGRQALAMRLTSPPRALHPATIVEQCQRALPFPIHSLLALPRSLVALGRSRRGRHYRRPKLHATHVAAVLPSRNCMCRLIALAYSCLAKYD